MSKVICIDLEMNQPSGKIIEIGYVIGDVVNGRIFEKKGIIVNPNEQLGSIPENNIHITDYTSITQEMVDNGVSLKEAYDEMCRDIERHNPTVTCVQWGDGAGDNKGDHDYLRQELGLKWDEFVFRPRAWDVKSMFQIHRAFARKGVASGLVNALKDLNLEFVGRPHRAVDDAFNTFVVFKGLGSKTVKYDKLKKLMEE